MKLKFTFMGLSMRAYLIGTCLLCFIGCASVNAQYSFTRDFSAPIQLSPTALPNAWSVDRYAPNGFVNSTDLGGNVIKESISTADRMSSRPAGYQTAFRNTQGRAINLPTGTHSIKADLYIPASWQSTNKRMAGLWAATYNPDNTLSEYYPVLEFASDAPTVGGASSPGFRAWNSVSGTWDDLGLPTGFQYDSWVTLEILLNNDGTFTYTVGDKTVNSPAGTAKIMKSAMFQGYNYDPAFPLDITNPGVDYDIYWDNLTAVSDGNNVYNITAESSYTSIQEGIDNANPIDTLIITGNSYDEQVLVNKSLVIRGGGSAMPSIDFTGTPTGKPTLFDVSADNVTIDSLHFEVDLSKLRSAVIASSSVINSISILNNIVDPYGTPSGNYGDRNAFSINYTGSTNYRVGSTEVNNIWFQNNTVNAVSGTTAFRSGLSTDAAAGVFKDNNLTSINQDLLIRFLPAANVMIDNNHFNGGGVELNSFNSAAGKVAIVNNTFDGTLGSSYTSSLRLKDNYNSKPTIVRNNTFSNHSWGLSLENFNADTIDNNVFTPLASAVKYRHITFNTKDNSSTSGYGTPTVGGVFTNNTFNGSAAGTEGIGIAFYNHDNDNPVFEPIVLGEDGKANIFQPDLARYIYLDNSNGISTLDLAADYPEYGGNVSATTTGFWTADIDGTNNEFDAGTGAGLEVASDMSYYQIAGVEGKITDKRSDPNVGQLMLKLPVINLTKESASTTGEKFRYQTIQQAIDAASPNDSIYAKAWVYKEDVNVNKAGLTLNGDLHYGSDTSIVMGQNTGNPSLNANANDVTISNLMVTRGGNNATDFATNPKVTGLNVGQTRKGITLRNLLVTGNRNGIYLNNVKGTIIENCDVIFNRTGIQLVNNCDSTRIIGNNILDNWTLGLVSYGISAGSTSTVDVNYNKIAGNWYSNVENRTDGTVFNFAGNNWGVDSVYAVSDPSGESGYSELVPVQYGGTKSYADGNHFLISGATDRVDYTAYLPAATPNTIDNDVFPGYIPQDTSIVYVDERSPTAAGMTKLERAGNIVSAGGQIVMKNNIIHSTLVPGKPFDLVSHNGNIVIDGIDFGDSTGVISLNQTITIANSLNLGDGIIKITGGDSLIIDAGTATVTATGNGFISGPLAVKNLTGSFVFPVGDSVSGPQYIAIDMTSGTTGSFAVSYADSGYTNTTLGTDGLTSIDKTQFWIFNRTSGDLGGKITLYDYTNTIPLNSVIAHFGEDGKWHNLGGVVTSTSNPIAITALIASDDFSPFTIGSTDAALAVNTTDFTATLKSRSVLLSWVTETESNNKGFAVERSSDGKNWNQLSFVNTLATGGTSSKALDYTASDFAPMQGINYYRLKQISLDGHFEYSKTRSISVGAQGILSVYPNPASSQITVTNLQGRIQLFDIAGKLILSSEATSPNTVLDISGIAPGIYIIKDDSGHSLKFLKK